MMDIEADPGFMDEARIDAAIMNIIIFANLMEVLPNINNGKLRLIASTGTKRFS